LRGEVREVGGTLEDGPFGEAQVNLWFEEESTGDEDSPGNDNGASALSGKLVDGSLDGPGVDCGAVGDRAGFGNEELACGRGEGFRCERPEWSGGDQGVKAAAGAAVDRHRQILSTGAERCDEKRVILILISMLSDYSGTRPSLPVLNLGTKEIAIPEENRWDVPSKPGFHELPLDHILAEPVLRAKNGKSSVILHRRVADDTWIVRKIQRSIRKKPPKR